MRGEPQQCPLLLPAGPSSARQCSRQARSRPSPAPRHHVGRPGRELGASGGQVSGGTASPGGRAAVGSAPAGPHATGDRGRQCLWARCAGAGCALPARGKRHRRAGTAARDSKSGSARLPLSLFFLTVLGNSENRGGGKKPKRSEVSLSNFSLVFSNDPKNIPTNYSPVLQVLTHGSKAVPGL